MITFDRILPILQEIFQQYSEGLRQLVPLIVNRDLNGRVRLIVNEQLHDNSEAQETLYKITCTMSEYLGLHAFLPEYTLLFEADIDTILAQQTTFSLEGIEGVYVIDRLVSEGNWSSIEPPSTGVPRIVFFSIKGGVGRSTALSAAAWNLAESGKRVLVLDLDLESPGLSSSLLPNDRRPQYGIADWLVEDLVDNGNGVFNDMVATSNLSYNGEILVVPAHGREPGEYIPKLGRIWMPKISNEGYQESWSQRLRRLIDELEKRHFPDVILIDSRAGIDEVASACITDLSASLVLLFALDGEQTWTGYRILLRHWRISGVARKIRNQLQFVGAMIPELDSTAYFNSLRERAWVVFTEELYDSVPAGDVATEEGFWNFDEMDQGAPHYPWPIRWHRGFAALISIHQRFQEIDIEQIKQIFGDFNEPLAKILQSEKEDS